jgi:hypothetical protein
VSVILEQTFLTLKKGKKMSKFNKITGLYIHHWFFLGQYVFSKKKKKIISLYPEGSGR